MYNPCNFPSSSCLLLSEERKKCRRLKCLSSRSALICLHFTHTRIFLFSPCFTCALFMLQQDSCTLSIRINVFGAHPQLSRITVASIISVFERRGQGLLLLNQETHKYWHNQLEDNMFKHKVYKSVLQRGVLISCPHLLSLYPSGEDETHRSPLVVKVTTAAHVGFGGSNMNCWIKCRLHWNHQLLSVMMKTSLT